MDHNATSAPNLPPPYSIATQECPKQSTIGDPHIIEMLRTQEIDEPTRFAPQPADNSPVVPVGKKGQYVAFWGTDGKLYYARKPPKWGICVVLLIPLVAFLLIVGLIVGLTQHV